MSQRREGKLGIVVGGGPAPGINAVISAAAIRGLVEQVEVIGIEHGFEMAMKGDRRCLRPLTMEQVSRIHFRGGSYLKTSRANPTKSQVLMDNTVQLLREAGITMLVTIGGDDTAYTAMCLQRAAGGAIRVAHVPKTIDDDLDLPPHIDTFGYQTARHVGVDLVKNLMVDAYTTSRWYFAVTMGRKAGRLALGIGKAASATVTLIPEEFPQGVGLQAVVDTLMGAVIKRLASGRRDGVAVIAEGLAMKIHPADFRDIEGVEHDEHGHPRLAELNLALLLKNEVKRRLKQEFGIEATIVHKDIGYELRCADPIPFDMEYSRDLGYCAAKYLLSGGGGVMVSIQGGNFVPIPLESLVDEATGRTRVRLVDINSTRYAIARRYMIRVRRDDFEQPELLSKMAEVAGLTVERFRRRFEYLVQWEPPALVLHDPSGRALE